MKIRCTWLFVLQDSLSGFSNVTKVAETEAIETKKSVVFQVRVINV